MIQQIAEFNYKRNGFKVDEALEEQMLLEEEAEFADAYKTYLLLMMEADVLPTMKGEAILDTLVDMVDGYCDFNYVYYGTLLKYLGTGLIYDKTQKQTMLSTIITELLVNHGIEVHRKGERGCLEKAMQFVLEANDKKPLIKTTKKVKKGEAFVDPKELIRELLIDRGYNPDKEAVIDSIKKKIEEAMKPREIIDIKDLSTDEGE